MSRLYPRTFIDVFWSSRWRSKILGRHMGALTRLFLLLLLVGTASFIIISYFFTDSKQVSTLLIQRDWTAQRRSFLNIEDAFQTQRCPRQNFVNLKHDTTLVANNFDDEVSSSMNSSELPQNEARVLIIAETPYTSLSQGIGSLLEAVRFKHKTTLVGKSLPTLTHLDRGRFSLVIFEKLESYINLDSWNRQLLDKYCRKYSVGIIAFAKPDEELNNAQVRDFPLFVKSWQKLSNYYLNPNIPLLRLLKPSSFNNDALLPRSSEWTLFSSNDSTFEPIAWTYTESLFDQDTFKSRNLKTEMNSFSEMPKQSLSPNPPSEDIIQNDDVQRYNENTENNETPKRNIVPNSLYIKVIPKTTQKYIQPRKASKYWPVVLDKGIRDGIKRVFFGFGLDFWLHRILLLDSISYLSRGRLIIPLERYIMVDVDDIFVGKPGTRMTRNDVEEMLRSQERIKRLIDNFQFNLGFSGKYFHHGTEEENDGDQALLDHRYSFQWFPHSWSHVQAHTVDNISQLIEDMQLNKEFARLYDIPLNTTYSVAPHHSGVYPVHEPLYEAWDRVWGIRVTSTEEYPKLRPARGRRGFLHKGIMVLPRQTCGLFTHTIFFNDFPGGPHKLIENVRGGELFLSIMLNRIAIFMTHLSNYGNDRLALHVFESVFEFINCYTNVKLSSKSPLQIANYYFSVFPEEQDPIWRNPCNDRRHQNIWSQRKTCKRLPDFLVIGPQKTGTTALYAYLNLHPSILPSFSNPQTFEELQFFTGKNYRKGIDWYMDQFPLPISNNSLHQILLFEKSANYFSVDSVPERVAALVPNAHIIAIILSPAKRAYSWYQHQRAHDDPPALQFTFDEVVTANSTSATDKLLELKQKCLNSGFYAQHIERWLKHYDTNKLLIVDGENLRSSPVDVMDEVQDFLGIAHHINYSTLLKYNESKGFYCQIISDNNNSSKSKCLGPGKGRRYPPMSPDSELYLKKYYRRANIALHKLLLRLERPVPNWLLNELSDDASEVLEGGL